MVPRCNAKSISIKTLTLEILVFYSTYHITATAVVVLRTITSGDHYSCIHHRLDDCSDDNFAPIIITNRNKCEINFIKQSNRYINLSSNYNIDCKISEVSRPRTKRFRVKIMYIDLPENKNAEI